MKTSTKRNNHRLDSNLNAKERLAKSALLGYMYGRSCSETRYDTDTLMSDFFWNEDEVSIYMENYFLGVADLNKNKK